ncbi:hypothetical protein [Nocardia sp. IFM 10818]
MARRYVALSILPLVLAAGQGLAAAEPGQPGLAVPGDGQPGLSTIPAPPAAPEPSLADYIPDPPAPPVRPRPSHQTEPRPDMLVQQPEEEPLPETAPEVIPVDPHVVRAGTTTLALPDWVDTRTRAKVQSYLDYLEWQIAAGYDGLGFSRQESDRRAASAITGGLVSAIAGAELLALPAAAIGCGIGAAAGGVIGGVLGTAAAGVGMPFGAAAGAGLGCLGGIAVTAVPGIAVGATAGAILGGAAAGALGGGVDVPKPADPQPLVELPVLAPTTGQQISATADSFAATSPQAAEAVNSLRGALAVMPQLDPVVFGPVADIANAVRSL